MSFFSMSRTLFQSLFSKPDTVPLKQLSGHFQPRTRGHIENNIQECIFCGICGKRCPTNAIAVEKTESRWSIDRFLCIQCNCCVEVCPKKCLHMKNEQPLAAAEKSIDAAKDA